MRSFLLSAATLALALTLGPLPARADVMQPCPDGTHAVRTPPPPGQHLGTRSCVPDDAPPPTTEAAPPPTEAPPPSSAAPPPSSAAPAATETETAPAERSGGCTAFPGAARRSSALLFFGIALVLSRGLRRRGAR